MMQEDQAGFLNDPLQAKKAVLERSDKARTCRHCEFPLVRLPQGALVCSGHCDVPSDDPEFTRQVVTGQE